MAIEVGRVDGVTPSCEPPALGTRGPWSEHPPSLPLAERPTQPADTRPGRSGWLRAGPVRTIPIDLRAFRDATRWAGQR